jgi:hypothetical protein
MPQNSVPYMIRHVILHAYIHKYIHTTHTHIPYSCIGGHLVLQIYTHTYSQDITWFAPSQSANVKKLAFPSGTIELFARISDNYGAESQVYKQTITVTTSDARRLVSSIDWSAALAQVNEALILKNAQDVNKLASAIVIEAVNSLNSSSLPMRNTTDILSQIVYALNQSASATSMTSDFACEIAGVLRYATTPVANLNASTMDSSTVDLVSAMTHNMLQDNGVTSLTKECAAQFYAVLGNLLTVQSLLKRDGAITAAMSSTLITRVETSSFYVAALVAQGLIEGEKDTVTTSTSASTVAVRKSSTVADISTTLSGKTLSVSIPGLVGKPGLSLTAADLVSSVVSLTQNLPSVPDVTCLSLGMSITVAKAGSKTPLDVSSLSPAEAVNFSIPLSQQAPAPPTGFKTECAYAFLYACII